MVNYMSLLNLANAFSLAQIVKIREAIHSCVAGTVFGFPVLTQNFEVSLPLCDIQCPGALITLQSHQTLCWSTNW